MSNWIEINADNKHIAKEKRKSAELKKKQWWKQQIANGQCYYCKANFPPKELTLDHKIPLSRGGKTTKGNIVPACKKCNSEKNLLTPVDLILRDLKKQEA